jgi:hypothetical protein
MCNVTGSSRGCEAVGGFESVRGEDESAVIDDDFGSTSEEGARGGANSSGRDGTP